MKKILITVAVAVTVAFAGLLPAQEVKGPRIELKEMRYDLGKVVQGTQASHVFEVRNAGTETLVIDRVQPTWGCTAAVVSSDHLEPGAVGQIKATVDTAGKNGHMEKHVTIYSNDRTNPMVSLSMTLEVVKQ